MPQDKDVYGGGYLIADSEAQRIEEQIQRHNENSTTPTVTDEPLKIELSDREKHICANL